MNTAPAGTEIISAGPQLDAFRRRWSGSGMLDLLQRHRGRVLCNLPVGVGKSTNLDSTLAAAIEQKRYDLVIVLAPTKRIINERPWAKSPPIDVKVVVLKPRPRKLCGETRDRRWREYESSDLAILGRQEICHRCPSREKCGWPEQYGEGLQGARVIFATQAHLERDPCLVAFLNKRTGARRSLLVLDEDKAIRTTFRRTIHREKLTRFLTTLESINAEGERWAGMHQKWLFHVRTVAGARTSDLRGGNWRPPPIMTAWALRVQAAGYIQFGAGFRFLGYDLQKLGGALPGSREVHPSGNIAFAAPPKSNTDILIYSANSTPDFVNFRTGLELASPFSRYRFAHPDTRFYNLASRLGAKRNFQKNSEQILDFFAGLLADRMQQGRRPLLVSKKCFMAECARRIEAKLRELGFPTAVVVDREWDQTDFAAQPQAVPLINYGMIGTNLFEEFDGAYCLNSYNVSEREINAVCQDVLGGDLFIPLTIHTSGVPRRREVRVDHLMHRIYDVERLSNMALLQQEMDVVIQAIGRVRPFTRPREVILFQCGSHPNVPYHEEFQNLGEAREFFKIPNRVERKVNATARAVLGARADGLTQREIASMLGISERTVRRYCDQRFQPVINPK